MHHATSGAPVSYTHLDVYKRQDVAGALALFGLVRHHPAGHHQFEGQIESEIGRLQLPDEEVAPLVASGATLQLAEVVQEILSGR